MAKSLGCDVVIAEDVCRRAGLAPDPGSTREVPIRGWEQAMTVRLAERAQLLAYGDSFRC